MLFDAPSAWEVAAEMVAPVADKWRPLPHQIPPPGKWFIWGLLGGRGSGKTAVCARQMHEHVHGPPCIPGVPGGHWPAIIAPTLGDGVTACVEGPSGLRLHDPGVKAVQRPGGVIVRWSNGVEGKIFGASSPDDVERLRAGGNRCMVWADELAAWRYMEETWQQMRYGLRVGPWPHIVFSTTPKNRSLIKDLVKKSRNGVLTDAGELEVVITRATTADNPHLDSNVKRMLYDDYGGTRMGRQELLAEILEDVQGALWTMLMIDADRMAPQRAPDNYDRVIVAVDPAASAIGDEHGISVCASVQNYLSPEQDRSHLPHGFVLADETVRGQPSDWGHAAIDAYHDWGANLIVAEVNNGGDMVEHVIHSIDPTIPVKKVHATRGKAKRAEPVATLYEQHRVHHVGVFPHLEDQMTTWDAIETPDDWSPDRMDALVWGLTELLVGSSFFKQSQQRDRRLVGTR